ncbi:MAG: hypothetical protein H6659_08475 [Ardenticatenaceae bacterium]|nr:hypothetical protein [Ardenticatenaceae bacterium]MCB8986601.1 hypothetical protein [Ardenticatenaceae bacterium]
MDNMQHEMVLVSTYPTGAEEWRCPECERSFVLQWLPYRKVVLEAGDNFAVHAANHGGVQILPPQTNPQNPLETAEDVIADSEADSGLSEDLQDALEDFLSTLDWDSADD